MWSEYDGWVRSCGAPPLADLDFIHASEQLNLYVYPAALDYIDRRPLDATWQRLDSSVRTTEAAFELPEHLQSDDSDSALVYLSLGSLGSADIELMRRLVGILAGTRHRVIVSKGPLADELELADNMWGEAQVPQTSVLAAVDVVISHGGNNTTTESVHYGKPMVVLPLFWDQYDNAQRVAELGFGVRLATYEFDDGELTGALDRLLADTELRARVSAVGDSVRSRDGVVLAADRIERLAG
jgi:MGT family glycosyltransferase